MRFQAAHILLCLSLFVSSLFMTGCGSYNFPMPSSFSSMFTGSTPKRSVSQPGYIKVQKGDTVYSLSRHYNVPVRSMIAANRLRPPYTLSIGQKLRLPASPYHIVSEGDTLYSISRRYGVDVRSLARLNRISSPYSIYKGQRLALPGMTEEAKETVTARNQPKASASKKTAQKTSSKTVKTAKKKATPIPKPPARSGKAFGWPHKGKVLLSYGPVDKGRHNDGINIAAKKGDAVYAADNGVIAYAGNELKGFGNLVLIKHSGGWMTAYAHNDKLLVKRGQEVKRGALIAKAGRSGNVTSPQVHFEIRKGTKAVDPLLYLEKK